MLMLRALAGTSNKAVKTDSHENATPQAQPQAGPGVAAALPLGSLTPACGEVPFATPAFLPPAAVEALVARGLVGSAVRVLS
jgi:hypothetical protein